jgi:hypothetical protein
VIAFIVSAVVTAIMFGIVIRVARNRPPGTPMTWGEAFVGALFLFGLLLMVYGVVPDRWLRWADGDLKWRSDKIGIPLGGLGIGHYHLFGMQKPYLLFPHGITFGGRGKILVTAKTIEDAIAGGIYIGFLVAQIAVWLWWQKRGKQAAKAIEKVSAYGRPLVRST